MHPPRTYEVQAGYGLGLLQSEAVVAWAIEALVAGSDSPSLRILAGLESPLDPEEIKRYYSAVCKELRIQILGEGAEVQCYTQSVLRLMLAGQLPREGALKQLADLCVTRDYNRELYDFYLLYHAQWDLVSEGEQWYWDGADTSNIDGIIDDYARRWLEKHGADGLP